MIFTPRICIHEGKFNFLSKSCYHFFKPLEHSSECFSDICWGHVKVHWFASACWREILRAETLISRVPTFVLRTTINMYVFFRKTGEQISLSEACFFVINCPHELMKPKDLRVIKNVTQRFTDDRVGQWGFYALSFQSNLHGNLTCVSSRITFTNKNRSLILALKNILICIVFFDKIIV